MSEARYQDIQIESTLPKPWEHEDSFNDVLYEWMERAPWLAISAVAHFAAIMLLAAIPWNLFFPPDEVIIDASTAQAPEEAVEDPPEEEEEEIEEVETEEEPIIQDYEVSDHNEVDVDQDFELTDGDPDMMSNSPFDQKNFNNVIGVGGGAGGKYGGRFGGNRNLRAGGGGTAQALADGLEWLKNHQAPDGSWDVDEYWINNVSGGTDCSEGAGSHIQDTGITGLALLAFLGDGHTMRDGLYKDVVTKGIKWMRKEQDPETGLLGQDIGEAFLYDHAIASLAMAEAYVLSNKTPILSSTVRNATKYIVNSRNPYGAWRYQVPPIGENDTSVTGWMVFALKSAEEGGFKISKETYAGALTWFDEVTDPGTGRMGYDSIGSLSSRVDGINDDFPCGGPSVPLLHGPGSQGEPDHGEARRPAAQASPRVGSRRQRDRYVLLVLRQLRHVSDGRQALEVLEEGHGESRPKQPTQGWGLQRFLGPCWSLGLQRRPGLLHVSAGPLPRSLLPLRPGAGSTLSTLSDPEPPSFASDPLSPPGSGGRLRIQRSLA